MYHKTNCWGRQQAWLNRELLLGLRRKRRVYHFWKQEQVTQEEYRDLIRLSREKIRKAKAHLELSLATVVRDNKKCFYKYINNKKRAKENLHPLLDAGENIASKHKEKAEVLNAFFASVFNSQTCYSHCIQPPELEDRDGEQNKPPIIQEETVNILLCHLDTHKSMGLDGIHLRVLRELGEELAKPLFHHLSAVLADRGSPRQLEACQCDAYLQEGLEGGSRELQACQPDLSAKEHYGVVHPECARQACEGQPGDQAQPAWVHERQVLLDQPDLLL